MSEVRRKVFLDLFAAPSTLLPIVGGATALIVSWAMGGEPSLTFGGIAASLAGFGLFASRLVFGLEAMTESAHEYVEEKHRQAREAALADLDKRLTTDRDPRTQTALRELRHLYGQFQVSVRKHGGTAANAVDVLEKVDQMFQVCVEQLEHSYQLWMTARRLDGQAQNRTLLQRDELIRDVLVTVDHIASAVQQYEGMKLTKKTKSLSRLRDELSESLSAAREAERRMAEWEKEGKLAELE